MFALLGVTIAACAWARWVTTHALGGGTETVRGLAMDGWWVFALGLVLVVGAAALLLTRSPVVGSLGVPVGILLLLVLGEVRSWISSVRGYLRVEGSAAGVSNPITRSVHRPFIAVHAGWPMQLLTVAAVFAIAGGTLAVSFSLARLARRGMRRGLGSDGQMIAAS